MLKSLTVQDFAIIEDIHIEFQSGMTVLTGETGAGKSLIIDTISLLLGQRADSDMIRYGKKKAIIEGVFSYQNSKIDDLLERYSIPKKEDLTIERQLLDTSKNTIKINGISVNLAILKQLSSQLAKIHSQNDTFKLFDEENYLELITPVEDATYHTLQNKYLVAYDGYLTAYQKYQQIVKGQKESQENLDYLNFEINEIKSLNLEEGLDETLKSEIDKLSNYDKIYSALTEAYEAINNEYFSIDRIYDAANSLKKIMSLDKDYEHYHETMMDCYYNLDEVQSQLSSQIQNLDFDQEELNQKIEAYQAIEKVKAKYHKSVSELIQYLDEITLKVDMIDHYDEVLKESYNALQQAFTRLSSCAIDLSKYRKKLAQAIEKGILKECQDLDLESTCFKITFDEVSLKDPLDSSIFNEQGIDHIHFMISFNEGEPLKPLHKVASGGEMSRIMLAFQSYFSVTTGLSLMVFDEIDTGVSGATAKKIAIKLSSIAQYVQVLCITHLPQVASIGDAHIHIYKEVVEHRTSTHFKYLSLDERVEEVALMLSGDKMSLYALEHAKALLSENH